MQLLVIIYLMLACMLLWYCSVNWRTDKGLIVVGMIAAAAGVCFIYWLE